MKTRKLLITTIGAALLMLAVACGTYIVIPVVDKMPRNFAAVMRGKKKVGIVALKTRKTYLQRLGTQIDFSKAVEGSVENAIQKFGYFTLIDLGSRKKRLREIAHSQSGLTRTQAAIGQELKADGLLYIQMTNPPLTECKVERRTSATAAAANLISAAAGGDGGAGGNVRKPIGVRYLTVFVKGKLVNIESGRSISFTAKKPVKVDGSLGSRECPSALDALDKALDQSALEIARRLSPRVVNLRVPVSDDVENVPENRQAQVQKFLERGIKWADKKNYERAGASWKLALQMSGSQSAAAFWNLAVYKWASGELDDAEQYFKRVEAIGGPDWLDGDKMEIITKFAREKKRIEAEKDADD